MQYADSAYYTNTYKGTLIPTVVLDQFLIRANFDIDYLTHSRVGNDWTTLFPRQIDLVKQAVCYQADHLYTRNDISGLNIQSISADGQSITYAQGEQLRFSKIAKGFLDMSGLSYAGIDV